MHGRRSMSQCPTAKLLRRQLPGLNLRNFSASLLLISIEISSKNYTPTLTSSTVAKYSFENFGWNRAAKAYIFRIRVYLERLRRCKFLFPIPKGLFIKGNGSSKRGIDPSKRRNDSSKRGNDPSKRGNDSSKRRNDPSKRGNDSSKRRNDSSKRGNDPSKRRNGSSKRGN